MTTTKHITKAVVASQFGAIPKNEGVLQRKARLLQGYYREEILHLPMGTGPTRKSAQKYCNMLVDGKKHGGNFLTPDIFEYATFRCHDKRNVETIEEFRLFNNMLSSQPMCFNLFVPLRSAVRKGERWVDSVFRTILPKLNIDRVINIEVEFVPVPINEYINDKSGFDAFVEFRTKEGNRGCIGIETKYVDSLGSNNPSEMKKKLPLVAELGCFNAKGLESIKTKCPQIVRNFLLTEKYRARHEFEISHSMVLALEEDKKADKEIEDFTQLLQPAFRSKITKVSLKDLVDAIQKRCPTKYKTWAEDFRRRYLDMELAKRLLDAVVKERVHH